MVKYLDLGSVNVSIDVEQILGARKAPVAPSIPNTPNEEAEEQTNNDAPTNT